MNELNKEFSENPNRREEEEEEEEERREKEEGRRRKKTNNNRKESEVVTQKERKKWLLYSLVCFSNAQTHSWPRTCVTYFLFCSIIIFFPLYLFLRILISVISFDLTILTFSSIELRFGLSLTPFTFKNPYPSLKPKYYSFIDGASTAARFRGKL
jgi:hypothetical protein